jgi:hypothetical protein
VEPQLSTHATSTGGTKQKKPRKQRENISRYPASVNFGITATMAQSLLRMCPSNGPFSQSTYLRLLLHRGLIQDDPAYAAAIQEHGGK